MFLDLVYLLFVTNLSPKATQRSLKSGIPCEVPKPPTGAVCKLKAQALGSIDIQTTHYM